MNLFEVLILQPIFNLLAMIYGLLPGSDFGIALIIFTVIVRVLMWPLIKKQLRQTRIQRAIQPELKKIREKAKGNKQLEGQLMMELYRERGINPFSGFGVLLLQLPIFIALFNVIRIITQEREKIAGLTYDFVEKLGPIHDIIHSPDHFFNESLLGLVNLSKTALGSEGIYWPLIIMALLAAVLQYIQSKQISPQPTEGKRLRDMLGETAQGKQVDQTEVSAAMTQKMLLIFPVITFLFLIYMPGALSLYMVVMSIVAIIQQKYILDKEVDEMESLVTVNKKTGTKTKIISEAERRADVAKEAEVIVPASRPRGKKRSKRR